jgi:hypothetical protein
MSQPNPNYSFNRKKGKIKRVYQVVLLWDFYQPLNH